LFAHHRCLDELPFAAECWFPHQASTSLVQFQ
jgi:hypothetical protein